MRPEVFCPMDGAPTTHADVARIGMRDGRPVTDQGHEGVSDQICPSRTARNFPAAPESPRCGHLVTMVASPLSHHAGSGKCDGHCLYSLGQTSRDRVYCS